jgi:dihydrofolate synthase/folylpolyglutamate synthase
MANSVESQIEALLKIHPKGFDLSLDRISRLLERLGNPQDKMPPIIHVAGTNGKGSTLSFLRAILEADGKRVHVHTSPHLVNFHERYRLGHMENGKSSGKIVSEDKLADALARVAKANNGEHITLFEILSAVTFVLFSENPADVALIEVGLGGRFDATNVIKRPMASVITPIALDHEAYLGDTIAKVAFEKAGIIKKGCPVIVAPQHDDARDVIEQKSDEMRASIEFCGQDYSHNVEAGRLIYQDQDGLMDLPSPSLLGLHQYENATTAIATLRTCCRLRSDFNITEAAYEVGITHAQWPARMQNLPKGKLSNLAPKDAELWLDGGHNPHAGTAIANFIKGLEQKPLYMIIGMLTTKEPSGYFEAFKELASKIYTVPIEESEAGYEPESLAQIAQKAGIDAAPMMSVDAALNAIKNDTDTPIRIFMGGSLYLAGEILKANDTPPQ